jgi:membrane associated rhomboid family serine protease
MLYDRPYMRNDYPTEKTPFLVWLLSATIAGFILQNIFAVWVGPSVIDFESMAALSVAGIRHGYLWTLVTYPLLHRNVLHLLVVMLGVFFIGRELRPHLSDRRLAWLTLAATVTGAVAWLTVNFHHGTGRYDPNTSVMGATPILGCFFIVFACLFPNREISFLVFFILPVTTRPKYVAWIVLGIDLCGLFFSEIPGGKFQTGIPYSAHLGAMLAGWLYYRYVHESDWFSAKGRAAVELPRWMQRKIKAPAAAPAYQVNLSNRNDLRAEVDRILDKINSHGFGSLSPAEKRLLDEARDLLSRR